jgi:hypothetical protein
VIAITVPIAAAGVNNNQRRRTVSSVVCESPVWVVKRSSPSIMARAVIYSIG